MGGYHEIDRGGSDDRRARDARIFVENLEDVVARLPRGAPAPEIGEIGGTDPTGTVHCVVTIDGTLVRVGIDDGWWDALGPGRVAAAILDAMRYAKSKAAMGRLVLDRYGHPIDSTTPDLGMIFTSEPSVPLPPYDADNFPDALARKLDRAVTILHNAERFSRAEESPERRVVTGPRGMFRVVMSGLEIVGAEVNEYGLHRSDAADLADDARAALLAATPSVNAAGGRR
jgi:hypothetical protein